ncbi:activator of the mannose operon (transcriptional antiterminator) [Enterococcus sp. PF1-24]|uniref:BglG family transcription antiterminator n=1 Tax=unclassified Enterococcus TaxID=2608891 RepID=UPI00247574D6|nr:MULTISPECIES: PTS sugar transporter subunit IIA [unclassified Enterococcus]MDH6364245.1 activator of the mannose operon (transcriptional antiterminator) [Enterococcus sp. PFB1-1]MDH6401396.1 activator of the mannose operon (transcriptional antiterminator) [Enterococcus sp. PF1-24]
MNLKNREKKLLQLLLEQEDYRPANFFTQELQVSAKTIYTDLANLDGIIKTLELLLDKVPRKGIYLIGDYEKRQKAKILLNEDITIASSYSPSFRRLAIFSQILFSKEKKSYAQLANDFFVSVTSIQKDILTLITFCQKQGIFLQELSQFQKSQNNESLLQRTYLMYFERYSEKQAVTAEQEQLLFGQEIVNVVETFIKGLYSYETGLPNEYLLTSLKRSLLVLVNRVKNAFHTEDTPELLFKELEKMQLYMVAIQFSDVLYQKLGIEFRDSDIYYVCSLLLAHGIRPVIQDEAVTIEVVKHIHDLIKNMSKLIDSDLSQDQHLFDSLLAHIVPMIYRLQIGIQIRNPLKEEIISQYSTMYTLASYSVADLERVYQIQLPEDELTFLTIHFQLAFEKVKNVKHVLIVCPSGLGTSQLIYQRIKQTLPVDIVLGISNFQQVFTNDLTDVDLVISTAYIQEIDIPVVYVSPLPTTAEIAEINQQLVNFQINDKKFLRESTINSLKQLVDPNFIILNLNVDSQKEAIEYMGQLYQEADLVYENFVEAIIEREALGTTGLISGVAIPHADPESVKETKLAIVTLAKPILWGKSQVSLIIFLTIAEKDIQQAKAIVASIYDLLNSAQRVQEITASQTKLELIQKFTREERR